MMPAPAAARRLAAHARKADFDMPITGLVPGMAYHFAGCCHPVPGDDIVGIVTTGKGVTIHAQDCPTLDTFAATPERFIDVDWDQASLAKLDPKAQRFTGRISVIANNEPTRSPTSPTPSPSRTAPSPT